MSTPSGRASGGVHGHLPRELRPWPTACCGSTLTPAKCRRAPERWACKLVPDERSALEAEIARLQGENAALKKELLAHGPPAPDPELKLPSDADIDKVISFLEKAWRRLIEMGRTVLKDVEKKN